ncbi:MAG: hybrid sensor histidine kinase/response regulator [Promethearchaeota archaeon]
MSELLQFIRTSNQVSHILLEDSDLSFQNVLQLLGNVTNVSRAYIFEIDNEKQIMFNIFEYISPEELKSPDNPRGIEPELENLQDLPLDTFPDWINILHKKNLIIVDDVSTCDFLPQSKEILMEQQIRALIVAPLFIDGELKGFVGFDECKGQRNWTQQEIEFLESNVENLANYMKTKALQSALQKYKDLVDYAPIGIFITSSTGKVLELNEEMARIVGASSKEEAIKNFTQLARDLYADPKDRTRFLQEITKTGNVRNFSYLAKKLKGETMWLNSTVKIREKYPDGTFLMDGFTSDISKQKQAEKIILEQERLSAIGEFASSVAHDFNNTLQGILGNIELALLESFDNADIHDYMDTIKKLSMDAASRIRQLQRFAGKRISPSDHQSLEINEIINDAIIQTRHLWKDFALKEGNLITIEKNLEPNVIISGNAGELRSALFNIIKNSVQAMPKGGTLTFLTYSTEAHVHLVITDTGIGMNEEVKTRIFQPFFSTKGFSQGKGLGMSGVYSTIQEHHGTIRIKDSQPGKGTSIEIILEKIQIELEKPQLESVSNQQARILWVDDEEVIREFAVKSLNKFQHIIDVAQSGEDALIYLEQNKYDLLITDVGMPGMTGWDLSLKIKDKYPEMQIAVITGWGNEITPKKVEKYQVQHILSKPVEIQQLLDLITKVMNFSRNCHDLLIMQNK